MKKSRKRLFAYDNVGILFVLPAFVYMLIFVGYPIVRNIVLSFQDVTVRTLTKPDKPFAGLQNYIEIFQDPVLYTVADQYACIYGVLPGVPVYHRIPAGAVF